MRLFHGDGAAGLGGLWVVERVGGRRREGRVCVSVLLRKGCGFKRGGGRGRRAITTTIYVAKKPQGKATHTDNRYSTYQDAGDTVDVAVDGVNVRQAIHALGLAVVEDDEGLAIGVGLHLHTDLTALEGGLSCGEKGGREGRRKRVGE